MTAFQKLFIAIIPEIECFIKDMRYVILTDEYCKPLRVSSLKIFKKMGCVYFQITFHF